jgi:hypothetical protein
MSDYDFDVFLSYKRNELIMPWIIEVEKRLTYWLTQDLGGYEAKIFFDKKSIEPGSIWPKRLQDGLKKSRCMVGIWSPEYFRSKWCVSEWRTFQEREKILGFDSGGLIIPLRFHDGEWFPDDAQQYQSFDISKHTSTSPSFWETARADELDQKIREFSAKLAIKIRNAPAFCPDWPVLESEPVPVPPTSLKRF